MAVQVMKSEEARVRWRDVLDLTSAGETEVVVERYGKPVSAVISYEHYKLIQTLLEEIRSVQRADKALTAWQSAPDRARPYAELRQELIEEGLLDGEQ